MHLYIKYLLETIKNAEKKDADFSVFPKPKTFEEEMENIERFVSGKDQKPIAFFTGIKKEDFPLSDHLSTRK